MEKFLIKFGKSIIPACDVQSLEHLEKQIGGTDIPGVHAYKVGFYLALKFGLPRVIGTIREIRPDAKVIYDHQKAGTDVPFTGELYANVLKDSGVDAAILFPREDDPVVQYKWTQWLFDNGIVPIIGGELTHRPANEKTDQIYINAIFQGVREFVVPGNKPHRVAHYTKMFKEFGIEAAENSPGFVEQGGSISDAGEVAGERWHAICGRATYNPNKKKNPDEITVEEIREATEELTSQILK